MLCARRAALAAAGRGTRALATASAPPVASIPAERWRVTRALLRDDLAALDPAVPGLLHMLDERGAGECWHKHGTFKVRARKGMKGAPRAGGRVGTC